MAINWDELLLAPVMAEFGEGRADDPASWPTYHPKSGGSFQLADAVFDAAYSSVKELADGSEVTSLLPVLGVRTILFAEPPTQGDYVYLPAIDQMFAVKEAQLDGHGHALLILIQAGRNQVRR